MKYILLALTAAIGLSACAGTKVVNTTVASGALRPEKIFIRPFETGDFKGSHQGDAMRALYQSQAPTEFAHILKEELSKLAPTTVLRPGERADGGWLVKGEIQLVDGGCPFGRGIVGFTSAGRSKILMNVRVIDADGKADRSGKGSTGNVLYDFDVTGGSRLTGIHGSVMAPGLGYAAPFDYRNAAERIAQALDPDRQRYGYRNSGSMR
jgi:hypothetical protein